MSPELYTVSFLESADQLIYENREDGIENGWNIVLQNKIEDRLHTFVDINPLLDLFELSKSLGEVAKINVDLLIQKNVKILPNASMNLTEVQEIAYINPEYIKKFFTETLDKIAKVSDSDKDTVDFIKEMEDGYLIPYKKKAVVITSPNLSIYSKSKDYFSLNYVNKPFNIATIEKFFIPFLKDYMGVQLGDSSMGFKYLISNIKKIKETYDREMIMALRTIDAMNNLKDSTKYRLKYIFVTNYIEMVKFIVALSMRYMGNYVKNVQTINTYVTKIWKTSDMEILTQVHESFVENGFASPRDIVDPLICGATKIINELKASGISPAEDVCDKRALDLPIKAFQSYKVALNNFVSMLKNGSTAREALERSDIDSEAFKKIINGETIDDSFLCSLNYDQSAILSDMECFRDRISLVFKALQENCIQGIEDTIVVINRNENNAIDEIEKEQAIAALKNLKVTINEAVMKLLHVYSERLNTIGKHVFGVDPNEIAICTNSFFTDAYLTSFDIMEESADLHEKEMNERYRKLYEKKLMPFLEAEGDTPTNNNQNGDQNKNKQNEKKSGPSVQDNSSNDNKQNAADNTNNNQNGEAKTSIVTKLKGLIDKVVESIKNFINGDGKKNIEAINRHRNYLMTRSYSNITVNVIPYQKRNYATLLNTFIDTASKLSDQNLKTMDEKAIANAVFASVSYSGAKVTDAAKKDDVATRLETAIAVGTGNYTESQYSNGEVKNLVNDMIAFVESYYGENGISSALGKVNLEPLKVLEGKKSNGDNDRTTQNVQYINSILNKAIVAVKNVARKRCNDYMVVLQSVWANDPAGKTGGNQNQNNNNNQDTNGGQEEGAT